MHLSRTSLLLPGILLLLLPCIASAKKHYFELDPQVQAHQPLPFRSFRVITPKYNDAKTAYYGIPHPVTLNTPRPLAPQIETLLANNACKTCDSNVGMAIAIQDFKFYDVAMPGEMMIVYIHADFFIGRKDVLHHIYTVDRWFHKRQSMDDLGSYSARYVSDCILSCVEDACLNTGYPSKSTFTDRAADNYYEDALQKYPLYSKGTVPKGIYKTVDDFINLTPLDTPLLFEHIPQAESQGFNWFYYKSQDGKKAKRVSPKEAYVISEGENFWLSQNGQFYKIGKQDGDLVLEINLESAANIESNYANGSFGLLLMAIEQGRTEPGAASMRNLKVLARFSPQKKGYIPYGGNTPILR